MHPALVGFFVALYAGIEREGGLTTRLFTVALLVSFCCLALPLAAVVGAAKLDLTDGDLWADRRETRIYLYVASTIGLALSLAVFVLYYPFWLAQRMTAAAIAVNTALAVTNRWMKPSIHCAGDAGIAIAVGWTYGWPWGAGFGLLVPAVAWARVASNKHTPTEVLLGSLIGLGGTVGCLLF